MPKPKVSPYLVMAFGVLAVSTAAISIRFAQVEVPSLVISAWRLGLAAIILLPVAITQRRHEIASLRGLDLFLMLLTGIFLALHFATWITSLEYTSVASSVVFVTTTPLWVALFSPIILKEPITKSILIGMLLALAGGLIIALNDLCSWNVQGLVCPSANELFQGKAFIGDALALTGAIMAAFYVMMGRKLRGNYSLIGYIFVVYSVAAVVLIALALVNRESFFGYSRPMYIWLLFLALVPQLLGHSIFNWSLKYVSAAIVSTVLLCEPIGSTLLAYLFLHETPTGIMVIGAILILVGIYIAARPISNQDVVRTTEGASL